jgi:ABC-type glutathione transport system ATPase component
MADAETIYFALKISSCTSAPPRGSSRRWTALTLTWTTTEAVVVLGESGCGKTSLAKAILRLLPRNVGTYSGKVYLDGTDVMALSDESSASRCAG